jgi:predicted secreted protein
MGWVTGIVVYILIWWTVIFAVLPWGLRRGADGKPDHPRLGRAVLATTFLSAALWCILYFLIRADVISFHDMAREMVRGDQGK